MRPYFQVCRFRREQERMRRTTESIVIDHTGVLSLKPLLKRLVESLHFRFKSALQVSTPLHSTPLHSTQLHSMCKVSDLKSTFFVPSEILFANCGCEEQRIVRRTFFCTHLLALSSNNRNGAFFLTFVSRLELKSNHGGEKNPLGVSDKRI